MSTLDIALGLHRAGINVCPVYANGEKRPVGLGWESRVATEQDIHQWYGNGMVYGIGTIGGKDSGGLETVDFDRYSTEVYPAWRALVEEESPGLLARLCVVRTPRDPEGYHVRYRCTEIEIPGNTTFAAEEYLEDGKTKKHVIIETRGTGGMAIAPGSPYACNPSPTGRLYEHIDGPPLTELHTITAAEREVLVRCAQSFHRPLPEPETYGRIRENIEAVGLTATVNGEWELKPGDDYNARGPDFDELLTPHGWRVAHQRGAIKYWRRPDKDGRGWSATTGYCTNENGLGLFAVFSTNAAPFPGPGTGKQCSTHSKFAVFALLNHQGNFTEATKALLAMGYGKPGEKGKQNAKGKSHEVGAIALRLSGARKTPSGKLTAAFVVVKDGKSIDTLTVTTAPSSRISVVKALAGHAGGDQETRNKLDAALGQLLVEAGEMAAKEVVREGDTIRDIVSQRMMEDFLFVYRTDGGAYSETRRAEVKRQDFISHVPSLLVDAAADASDAPVNEAGDTLRPALLKYVETELKIIWSDLMRTLPTAADAKLAKDSAAGRQFWEAMVRLWTITGTHETLANGGIQKASLISKTVSRQIDHLARSRRDTNWQRIDAAVNAWWRIHGGETFLAMRYEATHQLNKPATLPGVHDQPSLVKLGTMYGVIDAYPPLLAKVDGGNTRMAVLNRTFTDKLIADAMIGSKYTSRNPEGQTDADSPSVQENYDDRQDGQTDRQNASVAEDSPYRWGA